MSPGEERPTGRSTAGPVTEGDSLGDPRGSSPSAPPAGEQSAQDSAEATAAADSLVEEDLDALLLEAELQRDEYLDLAKRTKADFENFRKRMTAEVQAASARGKGQLAQEVIEAVDNLERALDAAEGDGEGLAAGVQMVLQGLRETLARHGVESLDPKGEAFDPQWHEALSTLPVEGTAAGVVVEVMQKGYRLNEQLIRPARVVVSE